MAGNKKPRKVYRERQLRCPMTGAARDELAFKIHGAVSSFIHEPSADSFNRCCTYMSIAGRAVANETRYRDARQRELRLKQFQSLILTAESIYERYERTGKLHVTESDKGAYRNAAAAIDGMLGEIDYSTFVVAKHQVYEEMRQRGMEPVE